jgi:hypothetical protein
MLICFSLSFVVLALHHHEDGVSHDNCSTCFYAVHLSNSAVQDVPQISLSVSDISVIVLKATVSLFVSAALRIQIELHLPNVQTIEAALIKATG